MRSSNSKSILLFIFEIILILCIGVLLYILNLSVWVNLIICILLMLEELWVSKLTYNNDNTNTKFMTRISFVMMGIGCFVYMVSKVFILIPNVLATVYMLLQGYFIMTVSINIAKRSENNAKAIIIISFIIYISSIVLALLALFGLAK